MTISSPQKFYERRYCISNSCFRLNKYCKPLIENQSEISEKDSLEILKAMNLEKVGYNLFKLRFEEKTININDLE